MDLKKVYNQIFIVSYNTDIHITLSMQLSTENTSPFLNCSMCRQTFFVMQPKIMISC